MQQDLIIELGTEELPPMSLNKMSLAFMEKIQNQLITNGATFTNIKPFATPRRIAVLVEQLTIKINTITEILNKATNDLPGKKMRWGTGEYLFARPIHWLVVLFGQEIIPVNLFGINSSNLTYGHRFLAPNAIALNNATEYEYKLETIGKVIVDFNKRKQLIITEIANKEQKLHAKCILDENLLEEVTAMVEYPVALFAKFSEEFLNLPQECLISAMMHHQKSFALKDPQGKLLAGFILISNMPINTIDHIVLGNQRVMHARLQDANFLYIQDLKNPLVHEIEKLKFIIFQEKLGSIYDQLIRIQEHAKHIGILLNLTEKQQNITNKAILLSKADLTSQMISEFPELQGIMGYYYAIQQGESEMVATAIKEHYLPRFAEDKLPESISGICLAIAYRLDVLFGLFAIGKAPTGEKDPFALRRHALAIIRILIEKKLSLNLSDLFNIATNCYKKFNSSINLPENLSKNLLIFCLERLKNWYLNNNINNKIFTAVAEVANNNLYDLDLRIKAITNFNSLEEAKSLINVNKRVNKLLDKTEKALVQNGQINAKFFNTSEELQLFEQITKMHHVIGSLSTQQQYSLILQNLLTIKPFVDRFFDQVMVMVEDQNIKKNRLILLAKLQELLATVANLGCLA